VIPIRDDNPTTRRAVVTLALIVINIAIYFGIQFPKQANAEALFEYHWAAVPCELHTGKPIVIVPDDSVKSSLGDSSGDSSGDSPVASVGDSSGDSSVDSVAPATSSCAIPASGISVPQTAFPHKNVWLAVFFSMFLHASILHVLGNMLFLWIFGNNVEDQLGPVGFLALYLVGGIVASLVHVAGNLDSTSPFLGASGAIAVVMGAYIVWFPRARVLTVIPPFFFLPFRLPAVVVLGLWFVLQVFTQSSAGIATLAHIGGFVFGVLVAYVLARTAGFPRRAPPARLA
jgi:membrane associated rhomboid family serine protease